MEAKTHSELGGELVLIPGGVISLRDDRIERVWSVEMAPFLLASLQVTQAQYRTLTGDSPAVFVGDTHPVESVSWFDALRYCNLLSEGEGYEPCYQIDEDGEEVLWNKEAKGYRLPTDAEWEYACRAGTREVRYGALDAIAWYADNAGGSHHPTGQKAPNQWGLFDMLGNVWEWCWDMYDPEVYGTYRVFRGGGWFDPERGCLASNRRRSHPTYQIDDLGFRIARSL